VIAVDAFLRQHPPFDDLPDRELERIARRVEIEFFAAGAIIVQQGSEPLDRLYVVRRGAVELLDGSTVIDLLGEGEVFGLPSITSGSEPVFSVRAHEDTLCYLMDGEVGAEVLATRRGLAFLSSSLRRRTVQVREHRDVALVDPRMTPISALIRRAPVIGRPDTTVRDAATLMSTEHVSSLLVVGGRELAIVTDRDLRSKIVAKGKSLDTPVAEVMTSPVVTLPGSTPAEEALVTMLDVGVHHLPVAGDREGDIVGMVSDTDLMGLERSTPFAFRDELRRAPDVSEVARIGRGLGTVVTHLVDADFDPVLVGDVVALCVDAMTRRLIELSWPSDLQGSSWCWIALGSEARREQAIATDQDHAIAFRASDDTPDLDARLATAARTVADGLEAAGIPRCAGNVMAEHPAFRRTDRAWADDLPGLLTASGIQGRTFASVIPDHRVVAGGLDIRPVFRGAIRSTARTRGFRRLLAAIAIEHRPPTGFIRDLVVEHGGRHAGTLDIKHRGIIPIAALARCRAIELDLTENATLPRLRSAADAGALDADAATELEDAFRFLWRVRLEHHARCLERNAPADDHVDPRALGGLTRVGLKEAFRAIARAQRALALEAGIRGP
jgi:CBS domain-containing protein